MKPRHVRIATLMALATVVSHAYGNGINPPPPAGSTILGATCVDRDTKAPTVMYRVRAISSDPAGTVAMKIPSSATKKLKLSDIRRIEIPRAVTNPGGYASATVDLVKPKYRGNADIRLGQGKTALRLTGFNESRDRVTINVSTCEILEIQRRPTAGQDTPQKIPTKD